MADTAKTPTTPKTPEAPKGPARSKAAYAAVRDCGMPETYIPQKGRTPMAGAAVALAFNKQRLETQRALLGRWDNVPKEAQKPLNGVISAYQAAEKALEKAGTAFKALVAAAPKGWECEVRLASSGTTGSNFGEGDYVSLPPKVLAKLVEKGKIPNDSAKLKVEWIEGAYASVQAETTDGVVDVGMFSKKVLTAC